MLGLLSQVITQARAAGKSVSVCGEMAGDPEFTQILLAMGLRSLSMHPSQIAAINHVPHGLLVQAKCLRDLCDGQVVVEDLNIVCIELS